MMIRFGHDFELVCAQDTPLVCMVSPRPERTADLLRVEPLKTWPQVPVNCYLDGFGNTCLRMVAPAGTFRIRQDAVIEDTGQLDPLHTDLREADVARLPADALSFLLPRRYVESDLLSETAWKAFGTVAPGWGRVQASATLCMGISSSVTRLRALHARQPKPGQSARGSVATLPILRWPSAGP